MKQARKGMKEAKDTQAMTLRVPTEVYEAMKTYGFATQTSMNEVALKAIRDFLTGEGHQEEVAAFLKRAQKQYRVALDKLADS